MEHHPQTHAVKPKVGDWDLRHYLIPEKRHPESEVHAEMVSVSEKLKVIQEHFIGYQANCYFQHGKDLNLYLDNHINNIGDPFQRGTFLLNSKEVEYAVARYYAQLWNVQMRDIDIDSDPTTTKMQSGDAYWGYVLSMGSSEGNIMSAWMGRDYIGGKYLIINKERKNIVPKISKIVCNKMGVKAFDELKETVFFTSTSAHYSVVKSTVLMNINSFT